MPRFYFHLDGRHRIADDEGEEFPNTEDAERHARLVASELKKNARPGVNIGESLVLADDRGRELLRIPLCGATQPR